MAAAESLILPALELNERTLKACCVLTGCNPVLTEICYCIMIWKGKEQYLVSRLQREYRCIECISLPKKKKRQNDQSLLPLPVTGHGRLY